jgi:hypothetical protein
VDIVYDEYSYDDRGYGDDRRYPDDRGSDRRPPPPDRVPPRDYGKPKKVAYKSIAGMVVAIVALIMIFIFMAYPWYSIEYEAIHEPTTTKINVKMEYNIEEISYEYAVGPFKNTTTYKYDDSELNGTLDEVKEIMDNMYLIHILVMIFLIIAIIVMPIAAVGKIPFAPGIVFLVLAILFIFIIPLYLFASLPPAIETQFDEMGDAFGEPMNETFIYKPDFLSSGRGTWFNDANQKYSYTQEWGPGMGFWFIFVVAIIVVIAEVVFVSGKADISSGRGLDSRPPPPPPPRGRSRDRPPRDYGPPRPMRDEDYDHLGPDRGRPPGPRGRDEYGYSEPPPPPRRGGGGYDDYPPPRRRGGYDYDGRPPPPPRPPRRREPY